MRIQLSLALLVGLPSVAQSITLNQVDTFQGSLNSWTDGHAANNVANITTGGPNGAGDGYLQVSSGSFDSEPRLITFNQTQWTGNYVAAGVGSISMQLKNFGTAALPIRIAIRDATGSFTIAPGYSTVNADAFSLPADGQWHLATFNLTTSDMIAVGGTLPALSTWLTNIHDFRLISSTQPALIGDSISARIGVDAITALPPPPNVWTGTASTTWNVIGNWSGNLPGATTGTANTDTATFNRSVTNSPLTIDAGRNLMNVTFDTATVNATTIGTTAGPALLLTSGGTVQTTSTVVSAETINAPLILEGNYTFTSGANSALASLTFGGGITPAAATGVTTLSLSGINTSANNVKGALTDHGAGLLAVSKSGAGTWILSGANSYSGGTTVSAGTLEFDTAPTIANNATFAVNGGTLRFKIVAAGGAVGTGVTATVASGATLELAGSVSALASGANRANVTNSSVSPAGVLVSGTNQVIGNITGAGNTQVTAGSSLAANRIVQNALLIGGTAASHAVVTIAASNAAGNPLFDPSDILSSDSGITSLVSLPPSPSLVDLSGSLNSVNGDSLSLASVDGTLTPGGGLSAVPEPSTLVLLALTGLALLRRFRLKPRLGR